jgi:hypothetical protein
MQRTHSNQILSVIFFPGGSDAGAVHRPGVPPIVCRVIVALVCLILLSPVFAGGSFAAGYQHVKVQAASPPEDSITVIGDSVTLGALRYAKIQKRLAKIKGISWCKVDARGNRQLADGVKLAKRLKKQDKLGTIVVYSLTTNGSFDYKKAKAAFKAVGKDRYVIFVTGYVKGYSYFDRSNEAVRKLAGEESRVFVADWNKLITGKKNKHLSDDYCHLNSVSGGWYVDEIKEAVREARKQHVEDYNEEWEA